MLKTIAIIMAMTSPSLAAAETQNNSGSAALGFLLIFGAIWGVIKHAKEKRERRKFGDKDYELIKAARAGAPASNLFVGLVQLVFGLFLLWIAAIILLGVR